MWLTTAGLSFSVYSIEVTIGLTSKTQGLEISVSNVLMLVLVVALACHTVCSPSDDRTQAYTFRNVYILPQHAVTFMEWYFFNDPFTIADTFWWRVPSIRFSA